jgi:hypothetical protein
MSEPIHEHQWPTDSRECVFLGRAAFQLSDNDLLWNGLRLGTLSARVYCVGRTDFAPVDLSPLALLNADREQVLGTWQIEVRETDRRRPARIRRAIPVPHWLYVTRDSFDKFMKARPAATTAAEGRLVERLFPELERNNAMKRAQAANFLNLDPKSQAFVRIWPEARKKAGLSERALPGRPKSPQ